MKAPSAEIIAYLKGEMSDEERAAFEAQLAHAPEVREEVERCREVLEMLEAASEQPIVRIAHTTIQLALDEGATDIHLVPGPGGLAVFYRIDGRLHEKMRLPKPYRPIIDRWKLMSECSLNEWQRPQEGHIAISYKKKEYDLRVTFLPTAHGERVTARILYASRWVDLPSFGLPELCLRQLQAFLRQRSGCLVVTGPVASGKTTLLYAMLRHLLAEGGTSNIMTLEDPVESILPGVSQSSVDPSVGLTYAAGARAVAQSDADVVMLGDLPDRETAERAFRLAGGGRLVLVQMHTASGRDAVQRLREMGLDVSLIARTLMGVLTLSYVRRICPACIVEYRPQSEALRVMGFSPTEDGPFRRGAGCEACGQSGFQGQVRLAGLWPPVSMDAVSSNERAREVLAGAAGSPDDPWDFRFGRIRHSLWDDAHAKVRERLTTVEEAARAVFEYRAASGDSIRGILIPPPSPPAPSPNPGRGEAGATQGLPLSQDWERGLGGEGGLPSGQGGEGGSSSGTGPEGV
jgi:type II secretory ATPase GspE/PulE/Tfp pilus assembly ATPase PilB-like protein